MMVCLLSLSLSSLLLHGTFREAEFFFSFTCHCPVKNAPFEERHTALGDKDLDTFGFTEVVIRMVRLLLKAQFSIHEAAVASRCFHTQILPTRAGLQFANFPSSEGCQADDVIPPLILVFFSTTSAKTVLDDDVHDERTADEG